MHERTEQAAVCLLRRGEKAFLGRHVLARALQELAAGGFAFADERRDLVVGEIEDVVQQQHRALGGRETLQHDEERHRHLIERLQTTQTPFVEIDGLGQTIASTLLATALRRVELVEAEPCHDGHQVGPRRIHLLTPALPPQPRFLHHVLCPPDVAEQTIGERNEERAVRFEDGEVFGGRTSHQSGSTRIGTGHVSETG
jgi:hypothetical protein